MAIKWIRFPVWSLVLAFFGWLLREGRVTSSYAPMGIGILLGYWIWVRARLTLIGLGEKRFHPASAVNVAVVTFFCVYGGLGCLVQTQGRELAGPQRGLLLVAVVATSIVVIGLHLVQAVKAKQLGLLPSFDQILDEVK